MKKKMIKMKKMDPESLDNDDKETKKDEPEITVDSKGSVSLKPKESAEDKAEKEKPKEIESTITVDDNESED
jgi:hypothetical protein